MVGSIFFDHEGHDFGTLMRVLKGMSVWIAASILPALWFTSPASSQENTADIPLDRLDSLQLIIRIDDLGFNHASNVALRKVLDEGVVTSVSVLVNTPWFDEAAAILREHPEVSVGVHLALNSEWREYRWGPVLPVAEVPSLVDEDGHFFGTRRDLIGNRPVVEEVAKELRAQVDLALRKGLDISYVDYHMGAALAVWEFQQEVEKLAQDYGLGISRYFGEVDAEPIYWAEPHEKTRRGIEIVDSLEAPGLYLMVVHPGMDFPEMSVLTDLNPHGPQDMSEHRQAETDMLCSPEFRAAIESRGITLVGYDELVAKGLDRMVRPRMALTLEEAYLEFISEGEEKKESY